MNKKNRKLYPHTAYVAATHPTNPVLCIDIASYKDKYFLSEFQILQLVKKRHLRAVTYKHKLFVQDLPPPDN